MHVGEINEKSIFISHTQRAEESMHVQLKPSTGHILVQVVFISAVFCKVMTMRIMVLWRGCFRLRPETLFHSSETC